MIETLNLVCLLGATAFYVDPDEEIDYLQAIIAKQEVTEVQPPRPPGKTSRNTERPVLSFTSSMTRF